MKLGSIGVLLGALVMGGVLLSGKATVNFNHTPKFDKIFQYQYYRYDYTDGYLNIYLTDGIHSRDGYLSLIQLINQNKNREIKLHLAGNGGSVDSTMSLWMTLHNHPKKVTTVVYGNVYSAHALLAFTGNKVEIVDRNLVFLFHIEAVNGLMVVDFCEKQKGTDRRVSVKKKCHEMNKVLRRSYDNTIMWPVWSILTVEERNRFFAGENILLYGWQITERLNK